MSDRDPFARVTRRRLLAWLGGLGVVALTPACAGRGGDPAASDTTASGGSTAGTDRGLSCVLSPEQSEGPYYLDLERVRRDIGDGRPGTPLALAISVLDADGCEPIEGAAVDVWHCDAAGVYSGVNGNTATFLRGTQLTDVAGTARFRTIYPGWYPGRAVHVHVKVHVGARETYTGQLYFDEDVTDTVYEAPPYDARRGRDTRNSGDALFAGGGDETLLTPVRDGDGYRAEVTLGVRRV